MKQIEAPRAEQKRFFPVLEYFNRRTLENYIQLTNLKNSISEQRNKLAILPKTNKFWTKKYWQRIETEATLAQNSKKHEEVQSAINNYTDISQALLSGDGKPAEEYLVSEIEMSIRVSRPDWGAQDVYGDNLRHESFSKATELCGLLANINTNIAGLLLNKAKSTYKQPWYVC